MRGGRAVSVASIVATLALAGCSRSAAPSTVPTPYPVATAADKAILTVEVSGFFAHDGLPVLALYGDGTLLRNPRGDGLNPPGPLLRVLDQTRLSPAEIQAIVRAADSAGLLGGAGRYAAETNDGTETVYRLTVDGTTNTMSTYEGWGPPGPSPEVRERLHNFYQQIVKHLDQVIGRPVDWSPYSPTAIEVTVQAPWDWPGPAVGEPALIWPLATDPATVADPVNTPRHGCMVITGSDVRTFAGAALEASSQSVWIAPSGPWELAARPVIPGAVPCSGGW